MRRARDGCYKVGARGWVWPAVRGMTSSLTRVVGKQVASAATCCQGCRRSQRAARLDLGATWDLRFFSTLQPSPPAPPPTLYSSPFRTTRQRWPHQHQQQPGRPPASSAGPSPPLSRPLRRPHKLTPPRRCRSDRAGNSSCPTLNSSGPTAACATFSAARSSSISQSGTRKLKSSSTASRGTTSTRSSGPSTVRGTRFYTLSLLSHRH